MNAYRIIKEKKGLNAFLQETETLYFSGGGHVRKHSVQLMIAVLSHSCNVLMDVTIKTVHARSSAQIKAVPYSMKVKGTHG